MDKAACSEGVYGRNYKELHTSKYVELLRSWAIIVKKTLSFIEIRSIFISSWLTQMLFYLRKQK
jgi:hypothetical protein